MLTNNNICVKLNPNNQLIYRISFSKFVVLKQQKTKKLLMVIDATKK